MNWAKIVLYALYILSFGISISEHGKPKTGNNNAMHAFIALILCGGLLWFV